MPYDSNGNYTLPAIYKAKPATTIMTEQHNNPLEDIQAALNSVLLRNGSVSMTGNWNMGQNKLINLADGTADTDAATVGQSLMLKGASTQEVTGPITFSGAVIVPAVTNWSLYQPIGALDADNRYVRGLWNATTDQRVLSIAKNKNDGGIYIQLDDNTNQRIQLFGDYATNAAINALSLTVVTKNASQGPGINTLGVVSKSGQPYCVDTSGVLRYLVKSPGTNATDVPIQSVGINNQRIYVSYNNDTQAAWLVRSPAEGSPDTRVGAVGIANGKPYFGYGGDNDASNPLWLALASDVVTSSQYITDFATSDVRVTNLPYNQREVSFNVQITSQGQYVPFPEAFAGVPIAITVTDAGNGSSNDAWPVCAPQSGWTAAGCNIFIGSGHVPRQVSIRAKGSR